LIKIESLIFSETLFIQTCFSQPKIAGIENANSLEAILRKTPFGIPYSDAADCFLDASSVIDVLFLHD
jgi:hypothetical protein